MCNTAYSKHCIIGTVYTSLVDRSLCLSGSTPKLTHRLDLSPRPSVPTHRPDPASRPSVPTQQAPSGCASIRSNTCRWRSAAAWAYLVGGGGGGGGGWGGGGGMGGGGRGPTPKTKHVQNVACRSTTPRYRRNYNLTVM